MKQNRSKIMIVVLLMVFVLSLTTTAFAESFSWKGSCTNHFKTDGYVTRKTDRTLYAYCSIDSPNSYNYTDSGGYGNIQIVMGGRSDLGEQQLYRGRNTDFTDILRWKIANGDPCTGRSTTTIWKRAHITRLYSAGTLTISP